MSTTLIGKKLSTLIMLIFTLKSKNWIS